MAGRYGGMPPATAPTFRGPPPRPAPPAPVISSPSSSTLSKAEQFADDKRRIISSCFSKVDADGQRKIMNHVGCAFLSHADNDF